MENAKRLLQQSASVKSVAYALGFASPSSFAYAFRKAAGMAPGRYKTFGTK
jgi:AraC family transcriptional regulator